MHCVEREMLTEGHGLSALCSAKATDQITRARAGGTDLLIVAS
jgi:hypothetical protein